MSSTISEAGKTARLISCTAGQQHDHFSLPMKFHWLSDALVPLTPALSPRRGSAFRPRWNSLRDMFGLAVENFKCGSKVSFAG